MNSQTKTNKRILALDILRGVTIAGMIMVNNPGTWGHIYAPLRHAEWNGLTPTDLVFPFFMFIMGISTYISLKKYNFEFSHAAAMKILKRTIIIFLIGLAIGWFSRFCYYWAGSHEGLSFSEQLWASVWTFDRIRILGVMQRLALCYGATAIIALTMKHRHIPYLIATLLVGYFILLMCGNGFAYNETNILSIVDRAILTPAHMYKDNGIDPEGLLSTIPSIAHVLLGFCVGRMMLDSNRAEIIDVKGYKKWCTFFEAFGVNPLFMYVLGGVLSILFGSISFPWGDGNISIHGFLYKIVLMPIFGETGGSLAYALLFVAINWCIGYQLYKRKIYIKI